MPQRFATGTRVSCPQRSGSVGTVLADDDARAWARTFPFREPNPDPEAVRRYVAKLDATDNDWSQREEQPVLWDSGLMWWEVNLRQATEDEEFKAAHDSAMAARDGVHTAGATA
jgi:hypothetical protein